MEVAPGALERLFCGLVAQQHGAADAKALQNKNTVKARSTFARRLTR
jgi:hypothetical protein